MTSMTPESIKLTLDLLLSVGAITAMSYAGWRFVWPVIRAIHDVLQRLEATVDVVLGTRQQAGISEQLHELRHQLNSIAREVRPNGGHSMNDSITVVRGELRALLDADVATARWSADRNGRLTWASKVYARWTGATADEMAGHGWLSLIHPADREVVRDEWVQAIEERRGSTFNFRLHNGSGGWISVYGEAAPILNGASAVIGWLGTLNRTDRDSP